MSIRTRARKGRSIRPGECFLLSTDDRSLDTHAVEQLLMLNGVSVLILKEEQIVSLTAKVRRAREPQSSVASFTSLAAKEIGLEGPPESHCCVRYRCLIEASGAIRV